MNSHFDIRNRQERTSSISTPFQRVRNVQANANGLITQPLIFDNRKPVEQIYFKISVGCFTAAATFLSKFKLRFWRNGSVVSELLFCDSSTAGANLPDFSMVNIATSQPPNPSWETFKVNSTAGSRWVPSFPYIEVCDRVTVESQIEGQYGGSANVLWWFRCFSSELPI